MPRRIVLAPAALLALALLGACDDKKDAATPTAPQATSAPAASLASAVGRDVIANASASMQKTSSTCRAYGKKKTGLEQAIAKSSANAKGLADLKAQATALDAIIKDACQ
jgi:hypothetical protein